MSPWDMLPYFQSPERFTLLASATPAQIVPADPMRILLVFFCFETGDAYVGPSGLVDSTWGGIPISSALPSPIVINQQWYGPLTASGWDCYAPTQSFVVAYSVSMYKWPKGGMPLNEQAEIIKALRLQASADDRYPAAGAEPPADIPGD